MATTKQTEPSSYMQTLTRYLSNIMNSTLLALPREIKELIYFDALSHAVARILVSYYCQGFLAVPLSSFGRVPLLSPRGVFIFFLVQGDVERSVYLYRLCRSRPT
jgi:hypothetical protein